jgi:hypothetical protein
MANAHAGEVPASASWRALPLERKLHWLLRLGVVGCFIGHGVYGVLTKEAWVPYFGVLGIDRAWAYRLMPWIGGMDVSLGLLMACVPLPVVLLHLTVWGLWTGSLRPLSDDSVWELVERAGNYGVPLAFLLLVGVPRRLRGWFTPAWPSVMRPLTADTARVIHWILRVTTCLLLGVCVWKMATETLFMTSGSLPFEWIERAGSYMAPLALYCLDTSPMGARQAPGAHAVHPRARLT